MFSLNRNRPILFISVQPKDRTCSQLEQESQGIADELRRSQQQGQKHKQGQRQEQEQCRLEHRVANRPRDIQQAMLEVEPQIVHLSSDIVGDQGLQFDDETGVTKPIAGDALKALFALFGDQVQGVVLNGCYSQIQAQAIAHSVPWVIGMGETIGHRAAIEFSISFYGALMSGRSVEIAYKIGCTTLQLEGVPETLMPVLHQKTSAKPNIPPPSPAVQPPVSPSPPASTDNIFHISGSTITNLAGSGSIHYQKTAVPHVTHEPPLVRHIPIPESVAAPAPTIAPVPTITPVPTVSMKKILVLTANPKGTDALRLDKEMREIEAGLRRSRHRDHFEIISKWAVRPDDLRRALLDHEPQIVHFSGHGAGDNGLVLENDVGKIKCVRAESLARLFKLFQGTVECVVLNACYSEAQADAIHQHVDYVMGMSQAIGDRAAVKFATGFYDGIGVGRSYPDAFELGLAAIDLEGISETATPRLRQRRAT